jgi:hypothetical protein
MTVELANLSPFLVLLWPALQLLRCGTMHVLIVLTQHCSCIHVVISWALDWLGEVVLLAGLHVCGQHFLTFGHTHHWVCMYHQRAGGKQT